MSGLQAFVEAAREMAEAIGDFDNWDGIDEAAQRFRALDHPECEHGCIGGVVLTDGEWFRFPCPIHGGEK